MKPCGLTFDLHGRFRVAAWGSNCIQVFTPEGVLLANYGSETLSEPTGIAVNGEGCQSLVLQLQRVRGSALSDAIAERWSCRSPNVRTRYGWCVLILVQQC